MRSASRELALAPTRGAASRSTPEHPGLAPTPETGDETDQVRRAAAMRLERYELERAADEGMAEGEVIAIGTADVPSTGASHLAPTPSSLTEVP
jgi:hypothetical protein